MPELRPTLTDLQAGLTLPTGARYKIVLPPLVFRVRLVGLLFDTDKTFLLPSSMAGIRRLNELYQDHTGKTVLVSGHADTAGSTDHNLALSVERAQAVAAFLQDDADDWLGRYQAGKFKSAVWGTREDQLMLSAVNDDAGSPYYGGVVTGRADAGTRAAIHRFQDDNSLPEGAMDQDTRRALISKYMATDGTTLPDGTTLVIHGCGESHPSVATADSVALAENRRVELFFFKGPVKPPPVDPCPTGGCAEYPQWVANTVSTIDVNNDPEVVVFIVDELGLPLRKAKAQLVMPDGTTEDVTTDDDGKIRPRVAPGASFDVVVYDVHEGGIGDSLKTTSGQHFAAGGDGPDSGGDE
ncbi:MAG TPA: OmpA family protein [Polyangia bacterium]|nr:OmpA family protein [Polyangia bacterium]